MTFDNDKQISGPHGPKLVKGSKTPPPESWFERWAETVIIGLLIAIVALTIIATV